MVLQYTIPPAARSPVSTRPRPVVDHVAHEPGMRRHPARPSLPLPLLLHRRPRRPRPLLPRSQPEQQTDSPSAASRLVQSAAKLLRSGHPPTHTSTQRPYPAAPHSAILPGSIYDGARPSIFGSCAASWSRVRVPGRNISSSPLPATWHTGKRPRQHGVGRTCVCVCVCAVGVQCRAYLGRPSASRCRARRGNPRGRDPWR